MRDDDRQDRTDQVREEAEAGGYDDSCPDCRRIVATTGGPACVRHYVPVRKRLTRERPTTKRRRA